jgi:xylulokinase
MYLTGINAGTSGVKAVLVTEKVEMKAEAADTYDLYTPKPSWFDQIPEVLWNASISSIKQMLNKTDADPPVIAGIGTHPLEMLPLQPSERTLRFLLWFG